jgi:tetratricopeptide (TPR) repeat protein
VYRLIGDYEAALADLEQAIVEEPDSGWNYYERALIHQGMGNRDAAMQDLETADELAGETGDHELGALARYQLGLLLMSAPSGSTPTP